ncbi:MAG TPA: tRNA (N(6)-L-threonylcarbamoyladenosine(37)-C(2))-methylthiotransferase MtaB [Actinomycetota bacterium]|nr:tRNA (N(6)-L-threonylcarbamoyladenosine(37)-C(2))-methylthiotransferase MtaB [Actinomycetota bacterium]
MTTATFTTLGCRLNQAESDAMAEDLATAGIGAPRGDAHPDVVVVNTCTVTREATKASRMAIRRAVRSHPDAKIVVVGCYAVSDRAEVEAIEGVDLVLGNDEKEDFVAALGHETLGHETLGNDAARPLLNIGFRQGSGSAISAAETQVRVRANLKAQTGCDEWCSFCIIPTTRGPLRSMDEDTLVGEARRRVAAGARELVLTGVHLGKYTYDTGGDERSLIRLFQRLLDIEGVLRLRLSSILSHHLTPEVVGFLGAEPRMCPYLHVPLQSGDDEVLEAMNRPYRIGEYLEAIERVRTALPRAALATDIIVGFPGESDGAFANTMDVVRRVGFSKLHVFRFSARPDTAAAAMEDDVPPQVKKERSKRLIELGNSIRRTFLEEHLDTPVEVLVEDERVVDGIPICSGQTDDYVRVWFEGRGLLGRVVEVRGDEIRADGLRGRLAGDVADSSGGRGDRLLVPAGQGSGRSVVNGRGGRSG